MGRRKEKKISKRPESKIGTFGGWRKRGEAMSLAQKAKEHLFVEGEVTMSIELAALAIGVSKEKLRGMSEKGQALLIKVEREEVTFELKPQADETARNLWDELMNSLKQGRSSGSTARREYERIAGEYQEKLGRIGEDEVDVYKLEFHALWLLIPPAIQDELRANGLSPNFLRKNIGIARSGV